MSLPPVNEMIIDMLVFVGTGRQAAKIQLNAGHVYQALQLGAGLMSCTFGPVLPCPFIGPSGLALAIERPSWW